MGSHPVLIRLVFTAASVFLPFGLAYVSQDQEDKTAKQIQMSLAKIDSSKSFAEQGPTFVKITDSTFSKTPRAISELLIEFDGRGGILQRMAGQVDDRYVINMKYGFRVVRTNENGKWDVRKICSTHEMRTQILNSVAIVPCYRLDLISLADIATDSSFRVVSADPVDLGSTKIRCRFSSEIQFRPDYVVKGGEILLDQANDCKVLMYSMTVKFSDRLAEVVGQIEYDGEMRNVTKSVTKVVVSGQTVRETTMEFRQMPRRVDLQAKAGPCWLSFYGFPEPPNNQSWIPGFTIFGGIFVCGVVIWLFVRTKFVTAQ